MSDRPDRRVGVFDTLLVQDGVPVALDAHLHRLSRSVHELYGETLDLDALSARVREAATAAGPLQRLRIAFSPDSGITLATEELTERPQGPLHLVVHPLPGGWGHHKWSDRALLVSWGEQHSAATDGLMIDEDDLLLETGRGNVFAVVDGEVVTPPLDGRILPGTTREVVLQVLPGLEIRGTERAVPFAELGVATEVFTASSIAGIRPVTRCELSTLPMASTWPEGPVTRAVRAAVEDTWARP